MIYCNKCGAKLADDANYCSVCGASVIETKTEEFTVSSDDLIKTVKRLIHEGNVRRIIIKDEKDKLLLDIPVTINAWVRCSSAFIFICKILKYFFEFGT